MSNNITLEIIVSLLIFIYKLKFLIIYFDYKKVKTLKNKTKK